VSDGECRLVFPGATPVSEAHLRHLACLEGSTALPIRQGAMQLWQAVVDGHRDACRLSVEDAVDLFEVRKQDRVPAHAHVQSSLPATLQHCSNMLMPLWLHVVWDTICPSERLLSRLLVPQFFAHSAVSVSYA
jgi:hypothetical protein